MSGGHRIRTYLGLSLSLRKVRYYCLFSALSIPHHIIRSSSLFHAPATYPMNMRYAPASCLFCISVTATHTLPSSERELRHLALSTHYTQISSAFITSASQSPGYRRCHHRCVRYQSPTTRAILISPRSTLQICHIRHRPPRVRQHRLGTHFATGTPAH